MAYFERVSAATFRPTEHVSGGWNTAEQHIAPPMGLLAHAIEADRDARRGDDLVLRRLSYDILGTVPMDAVDVEVRVLRPGRTIELVEAVLVSGGRPALTLRAWLMDRRDTAAVSGTALPAIPPPGELAPWNPSSVWPGGFIASVETRRAQTMPGHGCYWVRTDQPLIAGEPVSDLARAAGLMDIANGMTPRVSPGDVAYPNLDLTAHLFRAPHGDWLGFDTRVSIGPDGAGLTFSTLHDADGPLGTVAQSLTVRPR